MDRKLKQTNARWLGDIPATWDVKKLKYASTFCQTKYDASVGALPYIGLENIVSWNGQYIQTDSEYDISQSLVFRENDILWGKLRPYLAKVYQTRSDGCCSGEFCVIRMNEGYDHRYFWNLLISSEFVAEVDRSTYGTKMPRANADFIKNMVVPVPPLCEQVKIAEFLDSECREIDLVIEKTKKSVDEYKRLKQAVITEAVTKGIRGARSMKPSGIEWIGDIPSDWSVRRIKTLFNLRDEKNYAPLDEVNLISLYTDLGVVQHSDLEKTTGNKASTADGYKKVYCDDIVVNIILCWMGAIGRSAYDGVTSPAYDIYTPVEAVDSRFYHHYFRTTGFNGDCYKRGRGIMAMRWRTYSDQFRDIPVVYPPFEEQKEILQYLDTICSEIDVLIARKKEIISELEKYKKVMIYEYVTGKKEVQ